MKTNDPFESVSTRSYAAPRRTWIRRIPLWLMGLVFPISIAASASAASILVFEDDNAATSAVPGGIALLALTGSTTTATDLGNFQTLLNGGPWDLVILGEQNGSIFPSIAADVTAYVNGGGRMLAATWLTSSGLSTLFEASPASVNDTTITTDGNPIFAGIGPTITLTNPGWGTFSRAWTPTGSAVGAGTLGTGSAVIIGNSGRTLLQGPLFDTFATLSVGEQFIANQINSLLIVCGDNVLQGSEECDDGNVEDGDCCSSTCEYDAASTSCDDGQYCTQNEECDGAGTCGAGSATNCADSDACTADSCNEAGDTCVHAETPVSPASCLVGLKAKFQIKNSGTAANDKLAWQWGAGEAFDQVDLGTPLASTTYTLCVYDNTASVPSLAASIDIAASPVLWTSKDPKGLAYKDKAGSSEGVTKAQIKAGAPGKTKVKVSASGANLTLPAPAGATFFDQSPNVVVQLVNNAGTCWTSEFAPGSTKTNVPESFQAQVK